MSTPKSPRLAELPSLIWQFTKSDFSTFVLPNTGFGLLATFSAPSLTDCTDGIAVWALLLRGLPCMLIFNWGNLLVFDLANQRLPESIREDSMNKPWRPLPSGRISPIVTRHFLLGVVPAVLAVSYALGVGNESALILILTWMYNDLGGGDELTRDPIIAAGYCLFLVSSLRIAITPRFHLSQCGYCWLAMIGGMVLTTMHIQDLKDQTGDRERGRKTWPLVLGDKVSRRWLTGAILFWSLACVTFWNTPPWVSLVPICMGIGIGIIVMRGTDDARAWKLWCIWQVVLYALPSLSQWL
ncbi:UbiA family prenyltransferase [Aspergillus alliaceus]|uniref:UbiA family prenyltransferase n=1 Tax=Petromyces alliaceus TaxID=209559 RepID=UPI0012A45987|nr:UbiA prenyltransferase family [Aspergillus alliaceus]KAB8236624.1 UbiA prenyltransferase family [Aspergillus alliaceus]